MTQRDVIQLSGSFVVGIVLLTLGHIPVLIFRGPLAQEIPGRPLIIGSPQWRTSYWRRVRAFAAAWPFVGAGVSLSGQLGWSVEQPLAGLMFFVASGAAAAPFFALAQRRLGQVPRTTEDRQNRRAVFRATALRNVIGILGLIVAVFAATLCLQR